jgi:hypothetical protein
LFSEDQKRKEEKEKKPDMILIQKLKRYFNIKFMNEEIY